jgi:hypothetical protein
MGLMWLFRICAENEIILGGKDGTCGIKEYMDLKEWSEITQGRF